MESVLLVKEGLYVDSVVLMGAASRVKQETGVGEVACFMGSAANRQLLQDVGFELGQAEEAGPNDLIIAVRGESLRSAEAAAHSVLKAIGGGGRGSSVSAEERRPRSMELAMKELAQQGKVPNLLFLSIPGEYIEAEAARGIALGSNVFIFSDNVPVEAEVRLKKAAASRGVLCMGPDCGTAWIGGVGLGFANQVPRGSVGLVAASGTGMQEVACGIANAGYGISQGIGVGGRDLSEDVGAEMTVAAIGLLGEDPQTEVIAVISKPPAKRVLDAVEAAVRATGKPTVICCLGEEEKTDGDVVWVPTLRQCVDAAVAALTDRPVPPLRFGDPAAAANLLAESSFPEGPLIGLYSGGTLAHEAELLLHDLLGAVSYGDESALARGLHSIIDLGDDQYTRGRPHPMIDPSLRSDFIRHRVDSAGILLVDVVLGRGSHRDPAGALADAVDDLRERRGEAMPVVIASVTGTADDYQGREGQIERLRSSGVVVMPDNAEAALLAGMLCGGHRSDSFFDF